MMRRIISICILGIRAPFRSKLVTALLIALAAIVILLPRGIKGDGTTAGEIRMLLTWTLGLAIIILSAASLWAGCAAISTDIEDGRYTQTAVSPARSFEIWLGRWLGLLIINTFMVAIVLAGLIIQVHLRGISIKDSYVSRKLELSKESTSTEAANILKYVKSVGAAPEGIIDEELIKSIERDLGDSYMPVDPGQSRTWTFKLPKHLKSKNEINFHFSFISSHGQSTGVNGDCTIYDSDNNVIESFLVTEEMKGTLDFSISSEKLSHSNIATVKFTNHEKGEVNSGVLVNYNTSMVVLVPHSPFYLNIAICGITLLSLLALVSALGLVCGISFSFPVAAFVATAIVWMAVLGRSDWNETVGCGHDHSSDKGVVTAIEVALDKFSEQVSNGLIFITDPFAKAEALDRLGDSVLIEPRYALKSVTITGIIFPLILGYLGALILRKREV